MRIEFSWLRYHLILFSTVLVIGFVMVLTSALLLSSERNYNTVIENEIRSTKARTATLINDAALIDAYENDYDMIASRGFFSKESRLLWIEQLERTATRLRLNDFQYHIEPQLRVNNSHFNIPQNIVLFKSSLSFETGLLHEGDLVDIVNDLAALPAGLLIVDRCKISKINKRLLNGSAYNFMASCDLSWYIASYFEGMVEHSSNGP